MSTNIIDFNFKKKEKEEKRIDEIINYFVTRENFINELAIAASYEVAAFLNDNGYDIEDNSDTIKEIFLMLESIKGIIHRLEGTPYGVHDLTDEMFSEVESTEELMQLFLHGSEEDS